MQIEEAFRDLKNERYGLSFSATQTCIAEHLAILLLIGAHALFVLWLVAGGTGGRSAAVAIPLPIEYNGETSGAFSYHSWTMRLTAGCQSDHKDSRGQRLRSFANSTQPS